MLGFASIYQIPIVGSDVREIPSRSDNLFFFFFFSLNSFFLLFLFRSNFNMGYIQSNPGMHDRSVDSAATPPRRSAPAGPPWAPSTPSTATTTSRRPPSRRSSTAGSRSPRPPARPSASATACLTTCTRRCSCSTPRARQR